MPPAPQETRRCSGELGRPAHGLVAIGHNVVLTTHARMRSAVRKAATFFIVIALLALLPLRALASVTIGFCAITHPVLEQAQVDHDHAAYPHGGEAPDSDLNADCNACAEHCTSASVLLPALPATLAGILGTERAVLPAYFAAGHVPEHLDPPPLAL